MKVDLIRKYKWYIFGAIAVVLIMSIGLSFCVWDNNSINKLLIVGDVAEYDNYPYWAKKAVGENFVDNNGLKWLIVDKKVADGKTDMVLMTYYVTEQRVYEPTMTNPDYNSDKNNIRGYLNNVWYPIIDKEIRDYVVPKLTAYQEGSVFIKHPSPTTNVPDITAGPPTYSMAWLPSENELGLIMIDYHGTNNYIHDSKLMYFPETKHIGYVAHDVILSPLTVATTKDGEAVHWWTRTPHFSHQVTLITPKGGVSTQYSNFVSANNWMRPCVQVRFS